MRATLSPELQAFVKGGPVQRTAIVARVSQAAATLPPGCRVLDAGAGNAPYRELFKHCDYRTHDWSESPHVGATGADIVGDLHDLPIDADSFGFVLCTEVLEHLHDPGRALLELRRVLQPGGGLLITVPFVIELHEEPYDFYRYTPYALTHLLEAAGFVDVSVEPLNGWWSTLAHVLYHAKQASRPADRRPPFATRVGTFALRQISHVVARLATVFDRLDHRRGFPIGWAARAHTPIVRPGLLRE